MAGAVGETLRGVAGEEENAIADGEWEKGFKALKGQVPLPNPSMKAFSSKIAHMLAFSSVLAAL